MNGAPNTIAASIFLMVLLSVIVGRYQGYVIDRDFLLQTTTSCDPATAACFVSDCELDVDLGCEPYAKVTVPARSAPACLEEHVCATFNCEGRLGCSVSYCADSTLEDGERCIGKGVPGPD